MTRIQTIIFLLNPVYVTLFWSIVLNAETKKKEVAKRFLGKFMLTAFILYLSHFFYFIEAYDIYVFFDPLYTLAYLLVYPMFYIYVRLLTIDKKFTVHKHGYYLIPAIVVFLFNTCGHLALSYEERIFFTSSILTGEAEPDTLIFNIMHVIYLSGRFVFFLQLVLSLIFSFKHVLHHNSQLEHFFSNMEARKLNWVLFFIVCISFTSVSSAILVILGREKFLANENFLILPSVIFTTMLFYFGLLGSKQHAMTTESIVNQPNDALSNSIPIRLENQLIRLFEQDDIYLIKDLKIWDITEKLGTNRTYVSKIINQLYHKNFCSFVNHFRVQHAIELMKENVTLTNDEIGDMSGFGSETSFYRAFENETGMTVGKYRKEIKYKSASSTALS
ncbi:MAG: helix-turn-helix domain-containing protein [Bacteroidota bacterium]